ncbi:conserved hypothetical protein [Ricinus communis]|uniref:Uncharacterized protein n=1 Tax=Ricinus communis TaxID=3988 RepID=B9TK65_RICCO|nr:conserved hypothetical protein [Ricinus communis]
MADSLVVVLDDTSSRSAELAAQLGLPLCASAPSETTALLQFYGDVLQLAPADPKQSGPIAVDFCGGANAHRLQGGAELIAKAVRGRSREPLHMLDATAGLGRDSFVLASRDFTVHMLEQSPIVAVLLADGLARAQRSDDARIVEIAQRMTLQPAEASAFLQSTDALFDVIYLDPMFPPSDKSALVKKEMRLFQQLFHGAETNYAPLLEMARSHARLRVVVKRPRKAEPLAQQTPDYTLEGKSVRFDVYVTR